MIHYSVVIPQRNATAATRELLPLLAASLDSLLLPYEIICVDDGSAAPDRYALEALLVEYPRLRVLRFEEPRGTSGALSAGLAAARGDLVIARTPQTQIPIRYLPHLIAHLSQSDLVVAQSERMLPGEVGHRLAAITRLMLGNGHAHDSEELFWAARREIVDDLALARGAFRVLPEVVIKRGFRVCRLTIAAGLPVRGERFRARLPERLIAGWLDRRFEPHRASELAIDDAQPAARLLGAHRTHGRVAAPSSLSRTKNEQETSL